MENEVIGNESKNFLLTAHDFKTFSWGNFSSLKISRRRKILNSVCGNVSMRKEEFFTSF
jgi:hypothetical protein